MVSVVRPLHGTAWLWSRYFLQSCLLLSCFWTVLIGAHDLCPMSEFSLSQTLWRFEPSSNTAVEQLQVGSMPPLSGQVFISNFNFAASWILITIDPIFHYAMLPGGTVTVRCQIALDSSEQCAWLPSDAFVFQILRCFQDFHFTYFEYFTHLHSKLNINWSNSSNGSDPGQVTHFAPVFREERDRCRL